MLAEAKDPEGVFDDLEEASLRNNCADDIEEDMLQEVYEKATEVSLSLFTFFLNTWLLSIPTICFSFNVPFLTEKNLAVVELN